MTHNQQPQARPPTAPAAQTPRQDAPTVDPARLAALPTFTQPPTHHLGTAGIGCFLEPPGHPRYYLRPVHNRHGNDPGQVGAASLVLGGRVLERIGPPWADLARLDAKMASLYRPLPMDHPRVAAWIAQVFRHSVGCYADPSGEQGPSIIPACGDAMPEGWAKPENLVAVRLVRKTYPAFQPTEAHLNGPAPPPASWWERAESDLPGPDGQAQARAAMAGQIRQSGDPALPGVPA